MNFFRVVASNVGSLVTSHANVRMRVLPDREMDRLASTLMLSNFFIKAFSYFLLLTLMQVSVSSECHFYIFLVVLHLSCSLWNVCYIVLLQ
jgi:hypothetical protein